MIRPMLNDPKFQESLQAVCDAALRYGGLSAFDHVLVVRSVVKQTAQDEAQREVKKTDDREL